MRYWEKVTSLGESMMPFMLDRELGGLAECRISLARLVDLLGDHERAKMILEANLRMRGDVPAGTETATVRGVELKTHEQLSQLLGRFFPRESEGLAAEEWAHRVAGRMYSPRGTDRNGPSKESELGFWIIFQSLSEGCV